MAAAHHVGEPRPAAGDVIDHRIILETPGAPLIRTLARADLRPPAAIGLRSRPGVRLGLDGRLEGCHRHGEGVGPGTRLRGPHEACRAMAAPRAVLAFIPMLTSSSGPREPFDVDIRLVEQRGAAIGIDESDRHRRRMDPPARLRGRNALEAVAADFVGEGRQVGAFERQLQKAMTGARVRFRRRA